MPRANGKKKPAAKQLNLMGERSIGRVLITGASSGIGAELAREFAKHGHHLVLVARSEDKLMALAGELNAAHDTECSVVAADLSLPDGPKAVVTALQDAGIEVDILVNNAGIIDVGPFVDTDTEKFQQLVALNVGAVTTLTSYLLPHMLERRFGRILNVASLAGFQPIPSMAVYAASKAYVLSFTESLSEELRGTGVRVTALCPGMTDTNMVTEIKAQSETAQWAPSFLISDPKEVAAEAYKATMSGQTILVPGIPNQLAAAWAQVSPRWVVRTVTGFWARQADWMKTKN